MSKRILVCLLAGLGDAIMASPMIHAIKQQRPDWQIDSITALKSTQAYVAALPDLSHAEHEEFLDYPAWYKLVKLLRVRARRYDAVILPYPAARWQYHAGALMLARHGLIAHEYRVVYRFFPGYKFRPKYKRRHVVDENADLLRGLDLSTDIDRRYQFPVRWNLPERTPQRTVAFHLISLDSRINKGNFHKSPPLETYAGVARALKLKGFNIAIVGAGAELELKTAFEDLCGFETDVITGSLRDSSEKLRTCSLVIASESGIAHLSAALRVPVVCVFAMTSPDRFSPIGNVSIVRPSDCPPCYDPLDKSFSCAKMIDFACIKRDVTAQDILAAALQQLEKSEQRIEGSLVVN